MEQQLQGVYHFLSSAALPRLHLLAALDDGAQALPPAALGVLVPATNTLPLTCRLLQVRGMVLQVCTFAYGSQKVVMVMNCTQLKPGTGQHAWRGAACERLEGLSCEEQGPNRTALKRGRD